ncbi:MAG TPA: hypothetical protein PLY34_07365 [Ferruginibacter sp.]|nr:hypothetical protein [Ferruginibacter sp.]
MKKLKLLLILFSLSFLAGCIDIEELIELAADNSGKYSMSIDMTKFLEFANTMKQDKEAKKAPEKADTTIYFKDTGESFVQLSDEEKRVFKDGYCKIFMDEANGKMSLKMGCPFKNMNDLVIVKKDLAGMMKKLELMGKARGKEEAESSLSDFGGEKADIDLMPHINPSEKQYTFTALPGKISFSMNDNNKLKDLAANDSIMQMMQQASMLMGDMTTTTIIKLPAPAKTVSNAKATLSDDKRTVTIKSIITDLMEKPTEGEYTIEY